MVMYMKIKESFAQKVQSPRPSFVRGANYVDDFSFRKRDGEKGKKGKERLVTALTLGRVGLIYC